MTATPLTLPEADDPAWHFPADAPFAGADRVPDGLRSTTWRRRTRPQPGW
jgi:hypothetical protein